MGARVPQLFQDLKKEKEGAFCVMPFVSIGRRGACARRVSGFPFNVRISITLMMLIKYSIYSTVQYISFTWYSTVL